MRSFTGEHRAFGEIVRDCKIRIMDNEMASELNVLARDAARVARQNPRTADFTRNILQRALREIVACFPVYRTYVDGDGAPTEADRRDLDWAVAQARRNETDVDPSVFDFLHRLLTTDLVAEPRSGFSRQAVLRFAMRVQQYSGPVMAKGLEDTAFYRYNRFVALNEVGGHPDQFGVSLAAFHKANAQRASTLAARHAEHLHARHQARRRHPRAAGGAVGDARGMGAAGQCVEPHPARPPRRRRGHRAARPQRRVSVLPAPARRLAGRADRHRDASTPSRLRAFAERIEGAMVKSMREAQAALHLGVARTLPMRRRCWVSCGTRSISPGPMPFSTRSCRSRSASRGWAPQQPGADRPEADPAGHAGYLSGRRALGSEPGRSGQSAPGGLSARAPGCSSRYRRKLRATASAAMLHMLENWQDGRVKLAVTAALLAHRRQQPELFAHGSYQPLTATGAKADQICAFARRYQEDVLIVAVARFPLRSEADRDWTETEIPSPQAAVNQTYWRDLFGGRVVVRHREGVGVEAVLGHMPVAALVPDNSGHREA